MKNRTELTAKEIKTIQRAGYLPDMTAEDIACDPEGSLWIAIINGAPKDMLDLSSIVADETGWDIDDSNQFARSAWKVAKKLIAAQ
jgi:hypothetical protein